MVSPNGVLPFDLTPRAFIFGLVRLVGGRLGGAFAERADASIASDPGSPPRSMPCLQTESAFVSVPPILSHASISISFDPPSIPDSPESSVLCYGGRFADEECLP